jgi:hypothetical protein
MILKKILRMILINGSSRNNIPAFLNLGGLYMPTCNIFKTFKIEDDQAVDRLIALEKTTSIKHVYMDTDKDRERKKKLLKQKLFT